MTHKETIDSHLTEMKALDERLHVTIAHMEQLAVDVGKEEAAAAANAPKVTVEPLAAVEEPEPEEEAPHRRARR